MIILRKQFSFEKNNYRPSLPPEAQRQVAPIIKFLKSSKVKALEKDLFKLRGIPFCEVPEDYRNLEFDTWEGIEGYYPMLTWHWDNYHFDLYWDIKKRQWKEMDADRGFNTYKVYKTPEDWVYQNSCREISDGFMSLEAAKELMKAIGRPDLVEKLAKLEKN